MISKIITLVHGVRSVSDHCCSSSYKCKQRGVDIFDVSFGSWVGRLLDPKATGILTGACVLSDDGERVVTPVCY